MKSNGPSVDSLAANSRVTNSSVANPPVPRCGMSFSLDFDGYAKGVLGLGPGSRVALWVRGCDKRCPGCIAPELWNRGKPTPVYEIASLLADPLSKADGLTVSGGEPFSQAEAVTALIMLLRERLTTEVLVYTGYTIEEIQAGPPAWRKLLSNIDILIDGPYIEDESNALGWRGSDNQRVHLLTRTAKRHQGSEELKWPEKRPLSLQMLSPTRYRLIGIPKRGDLQRFRELLNHRGLKAVGENE